MRYEEKVEALDGMLRDAGVKWFRARELLFLGGNHYDHRSRAFGLNRTPHEARFPRLVSVAIIHDRARDELGSPVRVLSAHRSPAYNRAVGGKSGSFHLKTEAIDAAPLDGSKVRRYQSILRRHRRSGLWVGGLGIYVTFAHADEGTDYNRDW